MYNAKLNKKILLVVLALIFLVGIFSIVYFVYPKESQQVDKMIEQNKYAKDIGNTKDIIFSESEHEYKKGLLLQYALYDENGKIIPIASPEVKAEIRYPNTEKDEFYPLEIGSDFGEEDFFNFPLWPPISKGEHMIRITYPDSVVKEYPFYWSGIVEKQATQTSDRRTESDGTTSKAYKIEDLDLSSFEEMYYIRPDSSLTRIEIPQDEYFWLKTLDVMLGNHTILIKKDGVWYQSDIFIVDRRVL